jgi:multimeric flavodoxin WrbA
LENVLSNETGGMKMKMTVVHGSMRKGNTYALTKEILNRFSKISDVEIAEICVADLNLPFCRSCHLCLSKGEENCPHYDITRQVKEALAHSDGIILSGTTYVWALNAAMKNFLDHFAYLFHRPEFFGKRGLIVTTSSGAGEKNVAKYLKTVMGQWGINGAMVVTQNTKERRLMSHNAGLTAKHIKKIDRTAERFYSLLKSKQPIFPSLKNIAVHNSFRAMSLGEFAESERDTQFWSRKGFVDQPYPVKAGRFKSLVGSFVFSGVNNLTKIIGKLYMKNEASPPLSARRFR